MSGRPERVTELTTHDARPTKAFTFNFDSMRARRELDRELHRPIDDLSGNTYKLQLPKSSDSAIDKQRDPHGTSPTLDGGDSTIGGDNRRTVGRYVDDRGQTRNSSENTIR